MAGHETYYSHAEIYDIAFDFRDVPRECDCLSRVFEQSNGNSPRSFLELAAGPALHSREFAGRGLTVAALDLSRDMVEYGQQQARRQGVSFSYEQGDMISFDLGRFFDLAAILMDSTSYLLDNDVVLAHLNCVADHLNSGGLYILEMGHPRYVFNTEGKVENRWEMSRGDKTVETIWGHDSDEFDPISQITNTKVTVNVTAGGQTYKLEETAPQRSFTANEFEALVRASGRFTIAAIFGAVDDSISFSNEKEAWRMVPVLQRL
jgi:SAM-dependent methyltransferase